MLLHGCLSWSCYWDGNPQPRSEPEQSDVHDLGAVKPPIPEGMGFLVPAHSLGLSQVMPVTTSQASCIH